MRSSLEIITIATKATRSVYRTDALIEAPNWSRDGRALLFNREGRIYRLALTGDTIPVPLDTGFAIKNNNDHGLSPDGTLLAVSDLSQEGRSIIYTLPATGGTPTRVTDRAPSYWHGWSPDGHTLAYCAERGGRFDIYTIPVSGGEETQLTANAGHNDGPDYSPDGRFIYFNSDRTGQMQIWRMATDGSGQQQVTFDNPSNWFPHPSPDGRWIALISYVQAVKGHPRDKDVLLRLISRATGEITVLASLFGGQGSLNVPSWSPDSREFAFVRYAPIAR